MSRQKPVIGITPGYDDGNKMLFVKDGYYQGIVKAGGLPMVLPLTGDQNVLDELFEICAGFLFCGGPDIDARYYGEDNMPYNGEISPYRDDMEIYLVKKAVTLEKPLFGICRGIQVMNTAMGGTLYQDIPSQVKDRDVLKHSQSAPKWYPTHEVHIKKGSKVWDSFGKEQAAVNSFHHQAVKDIAPGFAATSSASDGIVESIEHENHRFAVGVQWHPELMWEKDEVYLALFREFVKQAAAK